MKEVLILRDNKRFLQGPIYLADSFLLRFRGLMFRREMLEESGLLFTKVSQIHTHFMRFTIDVVYLDSCFTVLEVQTIAPWKIGKRVGGCKNILELNEGVGARFKPGMRIDIDMDSVLN